MLRSPRYGTDRVGQLGNLMQSKESHVVVTGFYLAAAHTDATPWRAIMYDFGLLQV